MRLGLLRKSCVVCGELTDKEYTCSSACAGKLSYSQRVANKERSKYANSKKRKVRKTLFNKYIKPRLDKNTTIIDFWGGGGFSDYIIEEINQYNVDDQDKSVTLIEVDNNKKLYPALKKYAREKTTDFINVVPYCGSLAEFCQKASDYHWKVADFIWLDYCGTIGNIDGDLEAMDNAGIINNDTTLAVTLFKGRDSMVNKQARIRTLDGYITDYVPMFTRVSRKAYKPRMGVYVYEADKTVNKWIGKEVEYYECTTAY
jgi:hypothetical protein